MAQMKKADLVEKIAKEQNLDPKDLFRMNMEELHKMDKVVPDASSSNPDEDFGTAFGAALGQDEKKPDLSPINVDLGLEKPIPTTFKVDSQEELERKTPGKFRKFIKKESK